MCTSSVLCDGRSIVGQAIPAGGGGRGVGGSGRCCIPTHAATITRTPMTPPTVHPMMRGRFVSGLPWEAVALAPGPGGGAGETG